MFDTVSSCGRPAARRSPFVDPLRLLAIGAILLGFQGTRVAEAQYMYLDSNGDGVHSAADVITATGTTNFDVWIRTDKNRDGSSATCPTGDGPLSMISYSLFVHASGGTVRWTSSQNLQLGMGVRFGDTGNDTQYYIGYGGGPALPPGDYKLCRLSVVVESGTPSLDIAATGSIVAYEATSFGSACSGNDFDNTLKLGSDWSDVDGLSYSASGGSDTPPTLSGPGQMTVLGGEVAAVEFTATDLDGDPVSLSLQDAPAFASVVLLSSSPGSASIRIHAKPRRSDVGSYTTQVVASDGSRTTSAPLLITVGPGPNHAPSMAPLAPIRVAAGRVASVPLEAQDSDGDAATFELAAGPAFAQVRTLHTGWSATRGSLVLRPGPGDVGTFSLSVRATTSDGSASAPGQVVVLPMPSPPAQTVRTYPRYTTATASADFNEDGKADIARVAEVFSHDLEAMLGDGAGNLTTSWSRVLAPGYVAVVAADWNHDGHADLAVGAFSGPPLQIYWGRGDGTFTGPTTYPDVIDVDEIRAADINGDGIDDLVASSDAPSVYVLLGAAGGPPVLTQTIDVRGASPSLTVGDYDLDGRVDMAVSTLFDRSLRLFYGAPDGRFAAGPSIPTGGTAYGLVTGDWDEDGILDLAATASYGDGALYLLRGDMAGSFDLFSAGGSYPLGFENAATDWNGDGHLDILPASIASASGVRLLLGTGRGDFNAINLAGPTTFGWNDTFADLNGDGLPDLIWGGDVMTTVLNTSASDVVVPARSFVEHPKRIIPIVPSASSLRIRVESADGSFEVSDVDPESVSLVSFGTGTVSQISAITVKQGVAGDSDGNGVAEYPACFAMTDVARLLSSLRGRQDVEVGVDGRLRDGRRFHSSAILPIIGAGAGGLAARVEPNPLNPEGFLRFTTAIAGAVSVRLFDVNGRLVRTIWSARTTSPGDQEVRIDGKDAGGRALRSGVYFYRIDGAGRSEAGRFTILK
jgi:hypothetical protein